MDHRETPEVKAERPMASDLTHYYEGDE